MDYSDQREWIRQKATEFPVLLGNRSMERIINDRVRQNYAIISADETRDHRDIRRERENVNLKIDRDKNSLVGSSTYESNEKNN